MSVICSLCHSFLDLCVSNHEQQYSKQPEGSERNRPSGADIGFAHHRTYDMLCASAQDGCHICILLRLVVNREGLLSEISRTPLQIKLSPVYWGEWFCRAVEGESFHIMVPCGPTLKTVADPRPRVITNRLDYRCSKPPLLLTQEETFTMLNKWLSYCREKHPGCLKGILQPLPTRVIDAKDDGSDPSLLLTKGQMGRYVALSHCWGSSPTLRTTTANLQSHLVRIAIDELPRNFQDAITVTRKLGFRYLWIDSLCIIQDSELDWLQESACMGYIYANASCTIAASSAVDSSSGFLLPKDHLEISNYEWTPRPPPTATERSHRWHIDSPAPVTYEYGAVEKAIRSGPLQHRAWVLQERIFSPRIIHFIQNQVLWECTTHTATEFDYIQAELLHGASLGLTRTEPGYGHLHTHVVSGKLPSRSQSYRDWYDIVMDYTFRALTYQRDRLPAIWPLAQDTQARSGRTYIAGLYAEDLIYGMLFRRTIPSPRSVDPSADAPTWSWASLGTPVVWTDFTDKFEPVAEVTDMRVELVHKELELSMGRTRRAAVTLSAHMCNLTSVTPSALSLPVAVPQRIIIDKNDPKEPAGSLWFDYEVEDFEKPIDALCVQLGHRPPRGGWALGVVVAPTGRAENEYRRVGYYERFFDVGLGKRLIDIVEKQKLLII